jgi:transcriptional regulator with XRE-family HTH domain
VTDAEVRRYIGSRLKAARNVKGWKQDEAAHYAGMARARLGSYERGDRRITAVDAHHLAGVYGVPVGWLFPDPAAVTTGAIADLIEVTS